VIKKTLTLLLNAKDLEYLAVKAHAHVSRGVCVMWMLATWQTGACPRPHAIIPANASPEVQCLWTYFWPDPRRKHQVEMCVDSPCQRSIFVGMAIRLGDRPWDTLPKRAQLIRVWVSRKQSSVPGSKWNGSLETGDEMWRPRRVANLSGN